MEWKVINSLLCFVVYFVSFCASENNVPVLMWESQGSSDQFLTVPALAEFSQDEFMNYFLQKVGTMNSKPLVVFFLEESLSMEDFSWQDANRQHSLPNLQRLLSKPKGIGFLPSVKSAHKTISKLENYGYSLKNINDLKNYEEGVLVVVRLDDAMYGEDRPQLLRRHDEFINETVSRLSSTQNNFITVLTGKDASWIEPELSVSRVRRQLSETNESLTGTPVEAVLMFNASGKILLSTSEAPKLTIDGETVTLLANHEDNLDSRGNISRLIVTYIGSKKTVLRFKFKSSSRFWHLVLVEYTFGVKEGVLFPSTSISAAKGSPYFTANPVEFYSENRTSNLIFKNLKTQAWTNGLFSAVESGAVFFTIPIWTGIFVIGLLSLIMIWGLTMVLDIKTMDQFDDPKGKTISISAAD